MNEKDYDQSKYIALDLDQFFRENDEFNMLKTLQEMYVSSYKLELEMKSLVTNELDSVLLSLNTILEMCSLIKGSKNHLEKLKKIENYTEYNQIFEEECKKGDNVEENEEKELESFMGEWMEHYSPELIKYEIFNGKENKMELKKLNLEPKLENFMEKVRNSRIQITALICEHLEKLTMKNYTLIKKNNLVMAYELLLVKVPLLLEVLKDLRNENFENVNRETLSVVEFHKKKLKSQAVANLANGSIETVIESSSTLILLEGKGEENLNFLLQRRLEMFNISTSSLPLGSERSLRTLLSHLFTNEIFVGLMKSFNEGLSDPFSCESYQIKLVEQLNNYGLNKLVEVKRNLMDHVNSLEIRFRHQSVQNQVEVAKKTLRDLLEEAWTKCATDKILNYVFHIGVSINNWIKIETDFGHFSEYFDNQNFVDNSQYDLEAVTTDLNNFLALEPSFNTLVNNRINSMLERANSQIQLREFPGRLSSLTFAAIQAYNSEFKNWIVENGMLDSLLLLNRLNATQNSEKMYISIANKYLVPLIEKTSQVISKISNEQLEENGKQLYMLMVAYAASNMKSFVNEHNGFRKCRFSEILEELALDMAMKHYLAISNSETLPKFLERDSALLFLVYQDKFQGVNLSSNTTFGDFRSIISDIERHREAYNSFKSLML